MKIFISYSHQDKFPAQIMNLWLQEAGHAVLRDESEFRAGKTITEEIIRCIKECDLFLVILSRAFYESEWTKDELGQARALGKNTLFVAITDCHPRGPDVLEKPLELWKKPAQLWRDQLRRAISDFQARTQIEKPRLDAWFSQHLGCNTWVKKRAERENMAYSRLCVGSCVELASKWTGWSPGEVRAREAGDFEAEPEVLKYLPSKTDRTEYLEKDNYALKSLREDLTDEPWLDLTLQRVSHYLVRDVAGRFDAIDGERAIPYHLFEHGRLPFPHSVVVHMVMITSDNYLLIGHRSSRPRFYENCWAISYEEHMRPSRDGANPFKTAIRGLKEELVGRDTRSLPVTVDSVRFFSLFRELDYWRNAERNESFWDINVGLGGFMQVPFPMEMVFKNWLRCAEDQREFRHLVAVPYTFDNLFRLLRSETFQPERFAGTLLTPYGIDAEFPDFNGKPRWKSWHPTTKIRLIRCLTYDFLGAVESKVGARL